MRKEIVLPIVLMTVAVLSCNLPAGTGGQGGEEQPGQYATESSSEDPRFDNEPGMVLTTAPTHAEEEAFPAAGKTEAPAAGETVEVPTGPCLITASMDQTVYSRPSTAAQVFGTLGTGMEIEATAQTSEGWWGFDPGVAQAANIGVFRYRWVQDSPALAKAGGCSMLPLVVGPPPGVCFTMPMGEVPVYAAPSLSAAVVVTMTAGDYAAVTGRTADNWVRLDLSVGSLGLEGTGWMEGAMLNMNGPCGSIPDVSP